MKFLSTAELFQLFLDNVEDTSWMTVELKKGVAKAMDEAYTQGLKDCKTLYEESSQRA